MKIHITARHTFAPAADDLTTPADCFDFADFLARSGGTADLGPFQAEAVLLRLLRRVREGVLPADCLDILAEDPSTGELVPMPVSPDGDFSRPFPGGFYEWRSAELF
jgi:hypothetical protein